MVRGTPDVLQLTIGVDSHASTAGEALSRNSNAARRLIAVLRSSGVVPADIQTSSLSLSPLYDDTGNTVTGYAVSNQVTASIHDIGNAGRVVDAAAKIAGNEIVVNGLYFTFDDDTKIVEQARTDAVRRARSQADAARQSSGRTARQPPVPDRGQRAGGAGRPAEREGVGRRGLRAADPDGLANPLGAGDARLRDQLTHRVVRTRSV